MKIQFNRWIVPNFCTMQMPPRPRQEGWKEAPSFPLAEVDADVLAEMCEAFRAEVFRKAGKPDPAKAVEVAR